MKTDDLTALDKACRLIAQDTDINNHNGALLRIAEYVQFPSYIKIFQAVSHLHVIEGHMPTELLDYRSRKAKEMMHSIKMTFPAHVYTALNSAL